MKVLHLFSDWKWTGPAEPTVSLCEALTDAGVDVTIAYRPTPMEYPDRTVEKEVHKRTQIKYHGGFKLNRYFSVSDWAYDIGSIRSYVKEQKIDIVHTNLSHDHFTALFSFAFSGVWRPLVIRSDHKRDGLPKSLTMSWAFGKTDGLVTFSRKIMDRDIANFRFNGERTCVIPPGITPYTGPVEDLRDSLGIKPDELVIGVIGRLKPDRGYDVILRAFKIVLEQIDKVKLVIVGRSSQIENSILGPLLQLGIADHVILAGYRVEDYFSMISAFDLFVMMRAGSDGSARALREVMAMGKPAVVSDLGMLPELVDHGKSGFVAAPEPGEVAEKIMTILTDDTKREAFGSYAKESAREKWSYAAQAHAMSEFYETLLTMGRRK
ncbi:MAG: glycosyltransferase family 4 protein [Syntrophobacterales bacterium]|jgi:glycosyltransferase involved in cell wall biosynthesis|nr:glycosyltransferase family 4 protein [Syntrophobacterales bacterium]